MGTKVIVVEFADKVLMMLDGDLKAALLSELAANKVDLLLSTAIKSIVKGKGATRGSPVLQVDIGECFLECDCFLSATGRAGCTDNLGLDRIGADLSRRLEGLRKPRNGLLSG
ncbi:unnamed protein product [Symbiodinium sp. CCMP2456]|nr:unnamed protein product [Symbiodinium sp. CCMP2456]